MLDFETTFSGDVLVFKQGKPVACAYRVHGGYCLNLGNQSVFMKVQRGQLQQSIVEYLTKE